MARLAPIPKAPSHRVPHPNLRGLKKSRDGCIACRRRRKKCDCAKPVCAACARLRLDCSYDRKLSWKKSHQQTLSDGECQVLERFWECGREHKGDRLHLINCSSSEISLTYDASDTCDLVEATKTDQEQACEQLMPPMSVVLDHVGSMDPESDEDSDAVEQDFLFAHFKDILVARKTFGESDRIPNDFRVLVVPGCSRFPALYYVALALSALDLAKQEMLGTQATRNKENIEMYYCQFVRYLNSSINLLYETLDNYEVSKVDTIEEVIVTLVLLCSSDITNKGDRHWVRHLEEAAMIFSTLSARQILDSPSLKFAYKYFTLRYILLLATLQGSRFEKFRSTVSWPIIESVFESTITEPMFGCAPKLVLLIYRLTLLDHLQSLNTVERDLLVPQYLDIWTQLEALSKAETSGCSDLSACSQCYILSTQILFCTLLSRGKLSIYATGNFKKTYEELVPRLMDRMHQLAAIKGSQFFPTWCLLTISHCQVPGTDKDENRVRLLRLIDHLEAVDPLCSIVSVRKAIEAIWKVSDLAPEDDLHEHFDWRGVLQRYGFLLALT